MTALERPRAWSVAFACLLLVTVAAAPAAAAAGQRHEVTWQLVEEQYVFDGTLGEGESRTVKLDVTRPNLTLVEALLTWGETGDELRLSGPDGFALSARSPSGVVDGAPARGRGGYLSLAEDDLNPVPDQFTVDSEDPADARRAAAAHAGRAGSGQWAFTVHLEDTGGEGARVDKGNAYVLTVVVHRYEAAIMRVVGLEEPGPGAAAAGVAPEPSSPVWTWAAMGLGAAALGLGGVIAKDRFAKRGGAHPPRRTQE